MADCPKCGVHLRLIDWKQKCPYCGANIFLYDLQERLMRDADLAEVQNFYFQKKLDRAKASFIGSKPAVARIFTSLLPVGALFLPLINVSKSGLELEGSLNVVKLCEFFSENAQPFFEAVKKDISGKLFFAALVCLVLSLLFLILHFALLFLACSPRGKARCYILSSLALSFSLAFALIFVFLPEGSFSVLPGIGAWLYVFLCAANFIAEVVVFKKGVPIVHKQCYVGGIPIEEYFEMQKAGLSHDEIRAEQYRRLTALQLEKDKELEKEAGKEAPNVG